MNMKRTLLTLIPVFCVGSLFAEFQKVDDFEDYTANAQPPSPWAVFPDSNPADIQVDGALTVVADPFGQGQGNVLAINPGVAATTSSMNFTVERALSSEQQIVDPIFESKLTTFYFKLGRPLVQGVPGEADMTWGIVAESARNAESGRHSYGSYSVLGRIEANGGIDIRDGGSYVNLMDVDAGEAMDTQTWYEIWFVVDHFTSTFSQYIKGGTDYPTQTKVYENAAYRNVTTDPLATLLFITSAGNIDAVKGKDDMYIDDIHIDLDGENLSSPGGAFQKVDDFESYTAGAQPPSPWAVFPDSNPADIQVDGALTVVADPFGQGQGNVLAINPGVAATTSSMNFTVERALSTEQQIVDPIFESKLATFYFKLGRPLVQGVPGEADMTWGIVAESARNAESGRHSYGSYSVLGRIEANGGIDIRDGGSYVNLMDVDAGEAMDTQTWYEIWFVVDHFTSTFSQYIKGGTDYPTQTLLYENAAYRNVTTDPLATLLFITSAGNIDAVKGKDDMYIDDIHIDLTGMNLNSPSGATAPPAPAPTAGKFVNISTRGLVGTGDRRMIGGFIISEGAQQVLIQAVGPELGNHGIGNALTDPLLTLLDSTGAELMANDDWEDAQGQAVSDLWGGTPNYFTAGSASSAIVIDLQPGSYTARVEGKNGTTGVALVEVYEID